MTEAKRMPGPGQRAPEFSLPGSPEHQTKLRDFHGRPVVLAFYPADFSPVCTDQMALYQAIMSQFTMFNAALLGISVDGIWCHRAFADSRKIQYPLLSDFEPKGAVASDYGVYDTGQGTADRALFVLDSDGVVAWSYLSPRGVNPGADGIIAALEDLDSNGRTPT